MERSRHSSIISGLEDELTKIQLKDKPCLKGHVYIRDYHTGKLLADAENLITDSGLFAIRDSLDPNGNLVIKQIWVTDNATAPATTDTTAEFCNAMDDEWGMFDVENLYPESFSMCFLAYAGLDDAVFNWKKIALIDESDNLLTELAIDFDKADTEIEIEYRLTLGRTA